MDRRHTMPFGCEPLADGRVRFALWAPAAEAVAVHLGEADETVALEPGPDGWFTLVTDRAQPGSRYAYVIDGRPPVPDPASRLQAEDVHGPSVVAEPGAFDWEDEDWQGRPWEEAVFYELHVGTFTPEGTFRAARERLEELAALGVTAVELMPVADFPGDRGWGYDGVLPFAPDRRYGTPEALKALVDAAHDLGLMVFLDVVYNHFGPEGNYLHQYAPEFFTDRHHTPWGAAINFDGPGSRWVREFFIHNALYWLEEYHFDGLRLDAVHAICDDSKPDILQELAARVAAGPGRDRHCHLVLENDHNRAHYMEEGYAAQWNDDLHHALHVLLTGEDEGYYQDYADEPARHLARCLAEGFAYQGDPSAYRDGARRGEPSAQLPPTAFVGFLQNHDQTGNRAFGERITELAPAPAVRAALSVILLAPAPPLLFMGQEWGTRRRFPFFCDLGDDLAEAVTEGRRREFTRFSAFRDPEQRARIPDPMAGETYRSAVLAPEEPADPAAATWLDLHRELLAIRRQEVIPRLAGIPAGPARAAALTPRAVTAEWRLGDGARLVLHANLGPETLENVILPNGRTLHALPVEAASVVATGRLPAWAAVWTLAEGEGP